MPQRISKKVEVFEESQNGKIDHQRQREKGFANPRVLGVSNLDRDEIIDDRRADHQAQKSPVPPAVEQVTRCQQKTVLGAESESPINQGYDTEKKNENRGIEKHRDLFAIGSERLWHQEVRDAPQDTPRLLFLHAAGSSFGNRQTRLRTLSGASLNETCLWGRAHPDGHD